jgi:hypothetical protein
MTTYRYTLDMFGEDGRSLGQFPVEPNWEPAFECTVFEAVRRGRAPAVMGRPAGTIEPIWDAELDAPYVSGFRARTRVADAGTLESEIPITFLRAEARRLSTSLVEANELKSGEVFQYRTCAYAVGGATRGSRPEEAFVVEEVAQALPLQTTALDRFVCRSVLNGNDDDPALPVFIPQHVIDEAFEQSRQAKDVETGGILIGTLHRDDSVPEIFAEVTAQIPATHTVASATKLTFTAESWAAVDAVRRLRGHDEIMLGWWHLHLDPCRACPQQSRRRCTVTNRFFSADDVHLHHSCFGRAYQIALLVSDSSSTGMSTAMFGWNRGVIEARSFHVLQTS